MKTACKKILEDLSAYTDGVLSEKDRASVSAHLAQCAQCRQELSALQGLVKAIGRVPAEPAPSDFSKRLQQRIAAESPLQRLFRRLFVPLQVKLPVELVTAAALAMAIFFIIQPSGMKPKTSDMSLKINERAQQQAEGAGRSVLEPKETSVSAPGAAPKAVLYDKSAGLGEPANGQAENIVEKRPPAAPTGGLETDSLQTPETRGKVYEPIELALFIGGSNLSATVAGSLAETPAEAAGPAKSRPGSPTWVDQRSTHQELQAIEPAAKDKEASSVPEDAIAGRPLERAADRVRALVAGLGGTVSAGQPLTDSPLAALLDIDIPTAGYALFCSRLQSLGTLKDSPPDIDSHTGPGVRVRLRLLAQPDGLAD